MTERRQKILIIDDNPINLRTLGASLTSEFQIQIVTSGARGLEMAEKSPPDLILLDVMMPEMDGYETCRRFKANPCLQTIPIIFVTAMTENDAESTGLELGAIDYITKPLNIKIARQRIRNLLERETLRKELWMVNRKLEKQNQFLLQERKLIENIIIKMRHADRLDERYLRYLVAPVEVTAGDMLLATFAPDGRQLVLLGDFTGHGLSAAIGGPLVTYIFYELAKRGFSGELILREINQQLFLRLPVGIFFAATMVEISQDRGQATHWGAGLPDTLLIHNHCVKNRISSAMAPLGILKNADISDAAIVFPLEKVDCFYIFSDGIIEAQDTQKIAFGMERLEAFLEKVSAGEYVLNDLIAILNEHVGFSIHNDDITIVEIQTLNRNLTD